MISHEIKKLIAEAKRARKNAYSPYYRVRVGAALLAEDGSVYVGCNVENISGSAVLCAESNALAAAIVAGQKKFKAIAVVGLDDRLLYPCGVCRQKLAEFAPDLHVYVASEDDRVEHHRLSELLPYSVKI